MGEVYYVRWHAIVHMSWFVARVQDLNSSHANPYACAAPGQGGSLVPPRIPSASHFDDFHPRKESCGENSDSPTRFGLLIHGRRLKESSKSVI
ncbi:hypothetical protein O181_085673, partial [Austropuccinia psidii MF-1]|nr:hypothetical protein [Austropuccinia psidii MF-1]